MPSNGLPPDEIQTFIKSSMTGLTDEERNLIGALSALGVLTRIAQDVGGFPLATHLSVQLFGALVQLANWQDVNLNKLARIKTEIDVGLSLLSAENFALENQEAMGSEFLTAHEADMAILKAKGGM